MPETNKRRGRRSRDPFDILSAIWILASNDENSEMSYRGLRQRLSLSPEMNERQLVAEHRELFRLTIPDATLAELKARYASGKSLPSWLKEVPAGADRDAVIAALTNDDFFRSQFRAEHKASRSPIEIVDWGLQQIERLRKAATEARDAPMRRWSSIWIPLFSTLVALTAVTSTAYIQRQASIDQRALKEYEVGFRPKVDSYTRFLQAISTSFDRAMSHGDPHLRDALNDLDLAAIQLEPFLKTDVRDRMRSQVQSFVEFCWDRQANLTIMTSDAAIDRFLKYRNEFRATLYDALFK